jgi:hypothetical protein
MGITAERFNQGMTYAEYKEQMTRNRERFEENEAAVEVDPQALAALAKLQSPRNVLVIAEDWCGDVISNVPPLGRLAEASGMLNVRIFLRDQNLDLIDQYLKEGLYRSIPVFAVFDENFNELGNMLERPQAVTDMMTQGTINIHAQHPEFGPYGTAADQLPEDVRVAYMQERNALRERLRPQINQSVLDSVVQIAHVS